MRAVFQNHAIVALIGGRIGLQGVLHTITTGTFPPGRPTSRVCRHGRHIGGGRGGRGVESARAIHGGGAVLVTMLEVEDGRGQGRRRRWGSGGGGVYLVLCI